MKNREQAGAERSQTTKPTDIVLRIAPPESSSQYKETVLVVTSPAYAAVAAVPPNPPPVPRPIDETRETTVFGSERSLTLTVTEEEAEALMAVLLLAPLEGGRTGDAMERVLSKLADVQRAFARQE